MNELLDAARGSCRACVVACACLVGIPGALAADSSSSARTQASAQGRTWDSIKKLPDWSGVWVLTDESWGEVQLALSGHDGGRLQLTPRYLAIRADHEAKDAAQFDNEARCIPVGIPESLGIPIGHEYLFTPERVTVIFENGIVRRIDTSGRPHPAKKELNPTFAGDSVGHWEGRTLVVDTIGLLPQAEFLIGLRVTEKTHLTERILRKDPDTLQIDTVMTDPEIFAKPYSYTRLYKHSNEPPFEYYPCNDANRDTTVNGHQTGIDLTPPAEHKP
jgi:hypothetical protein